MNYARTEQNTVAQVLRVDPFSIFGDSFAGQFQSCGDDVAVGWLWDGETFAAPPAAPALVPQSVSFRQAKTQLRLAGIWDGAIAAAEAITDPVARIKMLGLLLDSTEYERQRPDLIDFAKSLLGLTDAQLDALFIAAAAL